MIYGLTPINTTKALLGKFVSIEVNALLQIGIKVLKKSGANSFLIQLGRHTFTTKSDRPLEPGREYWAQMSQTKDGIIQLKRIHPKPKLLQKIEFLKFEQELFDSISQKNKILDSFKNQIMHIMATTNNRDEFESLTQMLLSLHNGILTLPLEVKGKKMLLQMRKRGRKNREYESNRIEFYASFNNLGPIEGEIFKANQTLHLKLKLFYPRSVTLLKKYSNTLKGFSSLNLIEQESPILPFWDGSEKVSLLDIKG